MSEGGRKYIDRFGDEFDPEEAVGLKELAIRCKVSPFVIYALVYAGFYMPFGEASFNEAAAFIKRWEVDNGRRFSASEQHRKNRAKKSTTA